EIETISMGDRSLWQIIPSGHRLFIRPMDDGVTTNMTVLTNKHSYQFDLKSLTSEETDMVYVARFIYPDTRKERPAPPMVMKSPPPPPQHMPPPMVMQVPEGPGVTQPVHPNYNYTYSGPDELAPLQVYDDGRSTFIRYS